MPSPKRDLILICLFAVSPIIPIVLLFAAFMCTHHEPIQPVTRVSEESLRGEIPRGFETYEAQLPPGLDKPLPFPTAASSAGRKQR